MLHIVTHGLALLALFALFWLTGRSVGTRLDSAAPSLGLQIPRIAAGIAMWLVVLFVFSTLHLLRAPVLSLSIVAFSLLGGVRIFADARARRHWLQSLSSADAPQPTRGSNVAAWVIVLGVAVVAVGLFILTLTPELFWDDDAYHLRLPKLYLEAGGFRPVPFNVYARMPHAIDLLYGLALWMQDWVLAKLLHFGFLLLLLVALYRLGTRRAGPLAGALAACFLVANHVVLFEGTVAYVDLALAFFLFVAFVAADDFIVVGGRESSSIVLAGVACGAIAATKLTGLYGVVCVAAMLLVYTRSARWSTRPTVRITLLFLLPALAIALPWYCKTALDTGNPFYPFAYRTFGGPEWSGALGDQLSTWQLSMGRGRTWLSFLLLPYRVVMEGGPTYDGFGESISSAWLLLIPLGAIGAVWDPTVRRAMGVGGLYFVLWSLGSQQTRFLLPALPLFAAGAAITLARIAVAPKLQRVGRAMHLVAVTVALVLLIGESSEPLSTVPSTFHRVITLDQRLNATASSPMASYINTHLPHNARLLMVNTNQAFFIDREVIADSFFEVSQIASLMTDAGSADGLAGSLRTLGVTHVLLDLGPATIAMPPWGEAFLHDARWVRPIYRSPDGRAILLALQP